jgi:hypothetical protein
LTGTPNFGHFRLNPEISFEGDAARASGAARGSLAKLDEQTVKRIRAEARSWPHRVLAKRYGLALRTISEIVNFQTWAHIA